jgi:hypothetical protein
VENQDLPCRAELELALFSNDGETSRQLETLFRPIAEHQATARGRTLELWVMPVQIALI